MNNGLIKINKLRVQHFKVSFKSADNKRRRFSTQIIAENYQSILLYSSPALC